MRILFVLAVVVALTTSISASDTVTVTESDSCVFWCAFNWGCTLVEGCPHRTCVSMSSLHPYLIAWLTSWQYLFVCS
ncbi:uncharacterized protein EDB93DRAFT_1139943 [Suillus bovinus]|uniref:uncharacterized protein n=1 Tax=Suillus bovinus TaxID=48563 RepID=UPI001B8764C9|nr:uncharacterized protein EDB93DRAFT_1139943 [Suillus bovinus]KAG2151211.1 hypothetical protein EDB93DRAFT_1139943 [Suillus bovinus]